MRSIRNLLIIIGMFISPLASADVNVNIGINVPTYPELVVVPGYPVYYAPQMRANYFFYDGMYWVYQDDYWYMSEWYNGPWWIVEPEYVPVFILRVPVRYYHRRPPYFIGWRQDAPPPWGAHWGYDWERQRRDWDRWDHRYSVPPAPLPVYQRQYSGDRYPRQVEQQQELHQQNYRYQPRDPVVQKQYQERSISAPAQQERPRLPEDQNPRHQDVQRSPEDRDLRQQDIQRSPEDRNPRQQDVPRLPEDRNPRHQDVRRLPEDRNPSQQDRQRYEIRQQDHSPTSQSQTPQEERLEVKRSNSQAPQQDRSGVQNSRQQPEPGNAQRDQQKPRKYEQQDNDRGRDHN